ncbi:MAG: hypothetical protein M3Q19_01195 [Pseudomonadota bacterium]|nr:hypothetical protein [Pseudomonadota bacterium]
MKSLLGLMVAGAAGLSVPPPGSAQRQSILNGLRPVVERRLGPNVEFKIALIRVQRDWAFVVADPQRKGGKPIDGWRIYGEHFGNMDGLRVDAVLRKQRGRWAVVDHAIGATDVWYCDVGPNSLKTGWGC